MEFGARSWNRRQPAVPDAVRRKHVAVGHEVAAADAEHAELVAVLLVDRVHVAELHGAEAAAQPEERVAVGPHAPVPVSNSSDCSICQIAAERAAELFFAAKAEVGVRDVDRDAALVVVGLRGRGLRHEVGGRLCPAALAPEDLYQLTAG